MSSYFEPLHPQDSTPPTSSTLSTKTDSASSDELPSESSESGQTTPNWDIYRSYRVSYGDDPYSVLRRLAEDQR